MQPDVLLVVVTCYLCATGGLNHPVPHVLRDAASAPGKAGSTPEPPRAGPISTLQMLSGIAGWGPSPKQPIAASGELEKALNLSGLKDCRSNNCLLNLNWLHIQEL